MALAPGLFSITTDWPVCSATPWPMARPSWSVALPAAKGTMKVMGLAGKSWAAAARGRAAHRLASRRSGAGKRIGVSVCRLVCIGMLVSGKPRPSGSAGGVARHVGQALGQRGRDVHPQVQQMERQALAVGIQVERVVHATV